MCIIIIYSFFQMSFYISLFCNAFMQKYFVVVIINNNNNILL